MARPPPKRCKVAHWDSEDNVTDACPTRGSRFARLPVEIIESITSYLARAEVKALRLVCKEIEFKVSAYYFTNVVVPFRPELYLSHDDRDTPHRSQQPSSALFANGMAMFESFGRHIRRFALSLEIDEDELEHTPIKSVQEAIPCFWGIYRWPHATYSRFSGLESIEHTADNTQSMREALSYLTKVDNLGLCCDAGLGFLVPSSILDRKATSRPSVFTIEDWRQPSLDRPIVTVADPNGRAGTKAVLEKMAIDAGYHGNQIDEAVQLLLDTEGTTLAQFKFDGRPEATDRSGGPGTDAETVEINRYRLTGDLLPTKLTEAQRELLLELDWAHRAMIGSYVVAMMDNARAGCFDNVTTLTIAQIPSSHVHLLYQRDFWEGFPKLITVSLGVIADWRRVFKLDPWRTDEQDVSPVEAVGDVHKLLNSFIGTQPMIESLHFEWICGGEFAPSCYQRNEHILPAPFLENPESMASLGGATMGKEQLLTLPYIKHLSLKNCWASPHVFLQTIRQMGLASLEKLELESVSLSGAPTDTPQLPLVQLLPNGPAGVNANSSSSPRRVRLPDWSCWSGMLEHFSPGLNTRKRMIDQKPHAPSAVHARWDSNLKSAGKYIPEAKHLVADEEKYRIKCLSLRSCGYVVIDIDTLETRDLLPPDPFPVWAPLPNNIHIQRSNDRLLGCVLPFIDHKETAQLTNVFDMTLGWEGIYTQELVEEAIADGINAPGVGRFSGVLNLDQAE